jgi:SAM-dependent methyltransferase
MSWLNADESRRAGKATPAPGRSILDTRPAADFVAGHVPGAASIPLEELKARSHELPPSSTPLDIVDDEASRIQAAATILRGRGHDVRALRCSAQSLTQRGPSRMRLWRPNAFLVECLDRISAADDGDRPGRPSCRRALDVACGAGRDAVYLAMRGFDVEAIDILPEAIERAVDLAARHHVTLRARVCDVRQIVLPAGAYDLISVMRFLHRPLWPRLRQALAPGGYLICEAYHMTNLRTGLPPRKRQHLVDSGELVAAMQGLEVLVVADPVKHDGRALSRLLARRPSTSADANRALAAHRDADTAQERPGVAVDL